jgi:hypothetical protein
MDLTVNILSRIATLMFTRDIDMLIFFFGIFLSDFGVKDILAL